MAFDKLEATPEVRDAPITPAAAMRAMAELFRLVTAQSHAYGGRRSRLIPAEVLEGSLLATLERAAEDPLTEGRGGHLDDAYDAAVRLQRHLAERKDDAGMALVIELLGHINCALDDLK
jgi:hypothetical protein